MMGNENRTRRSVVEGLPITYEYLDSIFITTKCEEKLEEGRNRRQKDGRSQFSLCSSPKHTYFQSDHEATLD